MPFFYLFEFVLLKNVNSRLIYNVLNQLNPPGADRQKMRADNIRPYKYYRLVRLSVILSNHILKF